MNRIKEMINQITREQCIISSIIAGIIILGGAYIVYSKNPNMWPMPLFQKTEVVDEENIEEDEFVLTAVEEVFTKEDVARGEYRNDTSSATTYVRNTEEVRVAVVIDENQAILDSDEQSISCGKITFVTTRVTGPAVLTNTLKSMFAGTIQTDFMPGNIIPKYHPQLTLTNVVIENKVAKIYLGGNFSGSQGGWCDSSLAIAQITETAQTFSTVESVEVYQNGSRIY